MSKTYTATVACDVRAYATVEIEADTRAEAAQRVKEIILQLKMGLDPDEMECSTFKVEWDTAQGYESLDDLEEADD